MRLRLYIIPVIGIYMLLVSATIVRKDSTIAHKQNITIKTVSGAHVLKAYKLNFFQRIIVKLLVKNKKLKKNIDADKLASVSLLLGMSACAFILLSLFIPYLILAALPAAIAAIIMGGSAVRNKTSFARKAKTGKALGLGALIVFGIILLLVVTILATMGGYRIV